MQIDVNGVKITLTAQQLQEIDKQVKKNKPVTERIQTLQDIYDELEIKEEDFIPYKSPKTKQEKSSNAQAILFKIAEVYNEGIVLDWTNTNQYKYFPYKYWSVGGWVVFGSYSWLSGLYFPAGFYYKSAALSEDAFKKFRNIFDDYWMI